MGLGNEGLTGTCTLSGDTCACGVTKMVPISDNETYKVDGTQLTVGTDTGPYCVMGDTAQFKSSNAQMSFSFCLRKSGSWSR